MQRVSRKQTQKRVQCRAYALAVQSLQSMEARRGLCNNVRAPPMYFLYRVRRTCEAQKRCFKCSVAKLERRVMQTDVGEG